METRHNFWEKMPVDREKTDNINKEILKLKENKTFTDTMIELPKNMSWYSIDIENDIDMIVDFLNENYHSIDGEICFKFTKELLLWELGFHPDNKRLAIGIMYKDKIVGCIFGIIRKLNFNNKIINGSETNLLCLDKKIRKLNLAPLLIQELTRRNNYYLGINQSIYTTSRKLPNILSTGTFYNRYLNYNKMILLGLLDEELKELGNDKLSTFFHYTLKNNNNIMNIKNLDDNMIKKCCKMLNDKLLSLKYSYIFDLDDFKHTFINNIVKCYVFVENNIITDMISWYNQPSLHREKNITINTSNLYYYFNTKNSMKDLANVVVKDGLENGIDRIRVLNIMDYGELENFNFVESSVEINYYIYNWKCSMIEKNKIGYIVF